MSAAEELRLGDTPDILFLIGCWLGESKRYRVYNLAAALERRGYRCLVHDFYRVRDVVAFDIVPRVVVFFRAPYDPGAGIVEALDYFRRHRVVTVFDVDDYVFEPGLVPTIAAISHYTPAERFDYSWGVKAYRSLMFCCDKATASTEYLVDRMRELGRDGAIVVNSLNAEQISLAETLLAAPPRADAVVRICYFSGSSTHQRDFSVCTAAVQEIMHRHPDVVFRLVGLLDLDDSWLPFVDRIERAGFMPALEMLRSLHECDINLAPLEEGNPFCEGKSELKFFEAAAVGVPTIASRTGPFRAVIDDGVNGLLATAAAEWLDKLETLVSCTATRGRIAAAARASALESFAPDRAARMALAAYGLESWSETEPRRPTERRPTIGWILPNIIVGGGGHRNIFRAAYHLERFGYDVRLYIADTPLSGAALRQQVRRHFYPFAGPVSPFRGNVAGEDVLVATHWSTVALAETVAMSVGEIMYFVQDFEPAFYPTGSEYLLAEDTYRKGLYGICSGPWCSRLLTTRYGMEVDFFRFPVDRDLYSPPEHEARVNRILFFAKPEMPRRCFTIGVQALRIVSQQRPDVEIVFFGSSSTQAQVDFPVTHLTVVPTLAELATLYGTARLGMVFSTTNPSLVPYEMMACGLPVVDLDLPGAEVNYGDRRDIALLAGPSPARIAQQVVALLDDEGERAARSSVGIALVAEMPTEQEMARRVEELIMRRVGRWQEWEAGAQPVNDATDRHESAMIGSIG